MEINKGKTKIMEQAPVKKRKRTARTRQISTISPPPNPTDTLSNTSSGNFSSVTTEEDEDLAHCLVLLSRGGFNPPATKTEKPAEKPEKLMSRRANEGKDGLDIYECKTCFKTFPSFQALGGHRASHKKPKLPNSDAKKAMQDASLTSGVTKMEDEMKKDEAQVAELTLKSPIIAMNGNNNNGCGKVRVHECSICGAEFNSGQALGGHMRRHRPLNVGPVEQPEAKKERNFLGFDLNMPAEAEQEMFESPPSVFPLGADLPTDLVLGIPY
ncbi:hypothetical protein LUZ60_006932 [Juncus effusus]|nr:hypothetical protein LUZ60_006932 [Juncus effusus]